MRLIFNILAALAVTVAFGQQTVTVSPYMAVLSPNPNSIEPGKAATLDLFLMDSVSMAPSEKLTLTASLSMPSMTGMMIEQPIVTPGGKPGHFNLAVKFPHAGDYKLEVTVRPSTGRSTTLAFTLSPHGPGSGAHPDMSGMQMKASLGGWPANREGSGTSWQPDTSPMFMKMLPSHSGFEWSTMGSIQGGYVDAGGERGGKQLFTNSMIMLMGRRETGGGMLGFDFMTSLDPIANGVNAVPDLFQTGETAHGLPIIDRQHPHNLFSEVAASYSHPLAKDWSGFVYGGPVGEPALGNVMFMHRVSGSEIPEAPISHHWYDSTHISFGVATVGLIYANTWKFEGSIFNGHEPGENRYFIGPEGLNSGSTRLSYNPTRDWSFSGSFGYLDSPEALSPGVNEHQLTLSAAYSHDFGSGDNLSATAYYGRKISEGTSTPSNAWLAEATYFHRKEAFFSRFERVDKDELYNVPPGNYTINKLLFGEVHTFCSRDQLDYGVGAYAGVYGFPGSLNPFYGRNPITLGVFLRVRPGKM